jgi:hypothetical protein
MTRYHVHIYREMRLYFPGIEADSPERAARIAADRPTDDAENVDGDCDGENLASLVDVAGDDEFTQSVTIDFEAERLRKAASTLLEACRMVVDRWERGDLAEAARACRDAVAAATGASLTECREPILIEVRGGVVQDVRHVPPGYEYVVLDHDDRDEFETAESAP